MWLIRLSSCLGELVQSVYFASKLSILWARTSKAFILPPNSVYFEQHLCKFASKLSILWATSLQIGCDAYIFSNKPCLKVCGFHIYVYFCRFPCIFVHFEESKLALISICMFCYALFNEIGPDAWLTDKKWDWVAKNLMFKYDYTLCDEDIFSYILF